MGYFIAAKPEPQKITAPTNAPKKSPEVKSNWEYYEQNIFRKNNYLPSTPTDIVRDSRSVRLARSAGRSIFYSRNIFDLVLRAMIFLLSLSQRKVKRHKPVRYKKVQTLPMRRSSDYATFGNIKYRELTSTAGENYSVKLTLDKLLLLVNQPILFAGRIDKNNNSVTITVKKKDKSFLASLINLSDKQQQLDEQSERISNRNTYQKLKEIAAQSNEKLSYLIVTQEQAKILKDYFIDFAYFEKEDKLNIAFLPAKADLIKKLIYPKQGKKVETPQQRNSRIYAQLKKNAAILRCQ